MTDNIIKYPNAEYVMPFMFGNDLFLPVIRKLLGEDTPSAIKYIYGSINTEWTNGRVSSFSLDLKKLYLVEQYLEKLQKYNITAAFTFTNRIRDKKQLKDKLCNEILDIAQKYKSHFIVSDDLLYNHIKSRYKNANMVCSVIKPSVCLIDNPDFDETRFYNEMLDKYEIIVIRPEYTTDNIDKLPNLIKDLSRTEVLINQHCGYNCKSAKTHYELLYEFNNKKISKENFNKQVSLICPRFIPGYKSVYMTQENVKKLVDMGITKLKIQGRDNPFSVVLDELCEFYFNDFYSKEELKDKINKISAQLIQENKLAALKLI